MRLVETAIAFSLCLGIAQASDLAGVYALISSVAIEPSADHPQRIVISGVFAMSKPEAQRTSFNDDYLPPQRGFLYFSLPNDPAKGRNGAGRNGATLRPSPAPGRSSLSVDAISFGSCVCAP